MGQWIDGSIARRRETPSLKNMRSVETADIVIVGGGLIGASVAFRLAQAGRKVAVVDRGEPGQEASSAAAGMLAAQVGMEKTDALSELCLASRKVFPE
ncbi:MAG: FAD-dependent oxidoreductase, partial [Acidobacteria bacterium]|nr:FAD-dependent oxidoreductase [Acidobacteriota bacterium]